MNMDARTYTLADVVGVKPAVEVGVRGGEDGRNSRSGRHRGGTRCRSRRETCPGTSRNTKRRVPGIQSNDSASAKPRVAAKGASDGIHRAEMEQTEEQTEAAGGVAKPRSSPARRHSAHSATCDVSRERHDEEQYGV